MARNKKNSPLDEALNIMGYNNVEEHEGVTNMDGDHYLDDDSVDNLDNNNKPDPDDKQGAEDNGGETKDPHEDNSNIPEDVLNRMNNSSNNNGADAEEHEPDNNNNQSDDNPDDVNNTPDPAEAEQIGAFFDAFAEALNWDISDEDKPDSIEGLIDYIGEVVKQNSTPTYSDERIAALDNYVRNGGKFEDFYQNQSQVLSYDTLDMEDENNQKAVVRDYMKMQGYSDEQISRKIERYEDADVLEDEANDAIDYLKRTRAEQIKQQEEQQEQFRKEQEQQAITFMNDLTQGINTLDNIRGINVPKEDRKALFDYITKVDADGLTQYQKDFAKNQVSNLIESAYFTMKGDALLGTARKEGQTNAVNKLRNVLKHQSKNHSTYNVQEEKAPQAWEIASKFLH